jgi:hypothetical protein
MNEPAYDRWRERRANRKKRAKDGTQFFWVQELRRELYSPSDPINQEVTAKTKEVLRVWCKGALKTMKEGEGERYVEGNGRVDSLAVGDQTDEMKIDFEGTCVKRVGLVLQPV